MSKENEPLGKQQNGNDFIADVSISSFIDQNKAELIGYQAFYRDGSNKFYKSIFDIQNNIVSNPLMDVKQVGKSY